MMERKFAKFFHRLVHEIIPDNGQRDSLFEALRRYQSSQKLHQLLVDLRELLDEPQKLELYEFIRPLILLRHQMEYSYLAPAIPGVRLRTIRLRRAPGQSLGFAVRGGYEFSVGVFVSAVEPGSQAEKQGLRVGDEIVRVNGFTIAEAIHDDVLNLIKSREEIVLKVTHIGMLPIKEHASDTVTWRYVEDMNSKKALNEVLAEKQVNRGRGMELKIFIDCTGYDSIGCGILSGPPHYPGIFVEKVRIGSLAQDVGLEVGDQIVEVNETSFLNIGHKEAVVVLKGSKQLNVIIRKHAGLPLFEQRKTPSRVSASSSSSTRPARSRSPPVSTQRSTQNTVDRTELDETQLIEQQLGRTAPFRSHTSMSSPPRDSQAGDQVLISTQAEVHSDSDSISGSVGEGARIPVEEPNTLELDGRELRSFVFPKNQKLGIEMEGGMGTPLAGRIVVAAVFEDGAAMEKGLETGDQLMMINGRKLTDVTVAQAEQILDQAEHGPKDQIQVVYTHSSFLNDQECVTYF
ncbi:hypothetical protein V1264_002908 [Littorina saxatilis]|uniref:PDZ domain-containing protein n=1 Tax=Littorina saxatilis TaxID=31220 RepID=A0AAN9B4Y3_9CAEN